MHRAAIGILIVLAAVLVASLVFIQSISTLVASCAVQSFVSRFTTPIIIAAVGFVEIVVRG